MSGMQPSKEESTGKTLKVACGTCKGTTNHLVLKASDFEGFDDEAGIHYAASFQIIQCQGCETISFRKNSWNSEDVDHETLTAVEREELYPDRAIHREPLFDAFFLLPAELHRIYTETIAALNNSQPILCGVGVRAIIETVVKDQSATGHDLMKKIDSLVTAGMLTKPGAEILHKLRTLGNNAAHQVKAHSTIELRLAMDVVDNLLQAVYILPKQAASTLK